MTSANGHDGSGPMYRVIGLLDRVKKSGTGYEASCPGSKHKNEDKHPSLSVGLGYDGRVLLKCHAGCDTADVLDALHLSFDDLFEHSSAGNPIRRFRLIAPSGQVVAEHVREDTPEEKIIRWEHGGKNGLNGVKTVDLPLYRLPDVLLRPDDPVIVCEGEKAAESLAELGLLAVGTVTGADKIPSDVVLASLQGREVWLWPDNDDVGMKHMAQIARRIQPPPKWIDWKEAPPKGDAADYVAAGGTATGVTTLLRQLSVVTSNPEEMSAADLVNMELPEPRWAIPGILPEGVALLVGKSKLGKSWLALDAAIAIAEGGVAWGAIEVEQGDVYYLALEDSKRRLKDRLRILCGGEAPRGLTIRISSPRADEGGIDNILDWLDRHPKARMVIIDVLGKFRPKESNSRRLYDLDYEAIAPVADVARLRGVCVLVIHHANKLNPEDPVDSVSGTTGLVGAADAICIFRRERGKADASLFVVGRDVEEQDLAFKNTLSQPGPHAWEMIGDAAKLRLSEQRRLIIDVVTAMPGMTATEVAAATGKAIGATRYLLFQMTRESQVRNREGRYFPPSTESAHIQIPPITPITLQPPIQNQSSSISDSSPYRAYRGNSEDSNGSAVRGNEDSDAGPKCVACNGPLNASEAATRYQLHYDCTMPVA